MSRKLGLFGSLMILLLIFMVAMQIGCSAPSATPPPGAKQGVVKIGVPADFTGRFANYGLVQINTIKMTEKEIRDSGGFKVGDTAYTFEMVYRDIRGDETSAGAIATELIKDVGSKFMIGGIGPPSLSITEVARANRVIYFVSATAVLAKLGQPGYDVIFPVLGANKYKSGATAEAISALVPAAKRVVSVQPDDATTDGNIPWLKSRLEELGMKLEGDIRLPTGTTDMSPFMTRAKTLKPDVLVIGNSDVIGAPLGKAASEMDVAPVILGWSTPYEIVKKALGRDLKQNYIWQAPELSILEPTTDGAKELQRKYLAFTGEKDPPTLISTSVWVYDFLYMLAKAMETTGTVTDVEVIAKSLRSLTYKGLVLTVDYDDINSVNLPTQFRMYENGQMVKQYIYQAGK